MRNRDMDDSRSLHTGLLYGIVSICTGVFIAQHAGYVKLFETTLSARGQLIVSARSQKISGNAIAKSTIDKFSINASSEDEPSGEENSSTIDDLETIYKQRLTTILNACKKMRKRITPVERNSVIHRIFGFNNAASATKDVFYICAPFKTGTKNWQHFGMNYSNTDKLPTNRGNVRKKRILLNKAASDNTVRILNVRHPFDRLVSAYEDKFVKRYINHLEETFPTTFTADERSDNATIYGIPSAHINKNECTWVQAFWWHAQRMLGMESTPSTAVKTGHLVKFRTFIKYIASGSGLELTRSGMRRTGQQHWAPQFEFCQPCFINYDIVTHVETLDTDMDYVRNRAHSQIEYYYNDYSQRRRTKEERASVAHYFKTNGVDRQLLLNLYERYKMDFVTFGYDFNKFLSEYDAYTINNTAIDDNV